ncbi:MAG: site-specific DNA-methyltransferase [Candidatus Nitrosotenuis sp.]
MVKRAVRLKNRGTSKGKKISGSKGKKVPIAKYDPLGNKDNIEQYVHSDKTRAYNPPVGLVTPDTDKDAAKKKYSYDPHLDPQLQWAGKAERTSFEVDTVSLHVHERIDPLTIIENVVREDQGPVQMTLFHYFEQPEQNPPLREAIQFYKHSQNWSNRLIAGDSLLVMNSLLQKEGMAGKIQMVYIDPPYGVKYGSNFQPFVNRREVTDRRDDDLTQEPEMVKAFRDTWELEIHSYLSYLRDRILLTRELLSESGSCFVQISDENLHHVKEIMDEVFGPKNFVRIIAFRKTSFASSKLLPPISDYIIWYAKDIEQIKYHQPFVKKDIPINDPNYRFVELPNGSRRPMTSEERTNPSILPSGSRIYRYSDITSPGKSSHDDRFEFNKEIFTPGPRRHWRISIDGMKKLVVERRIEKFGSQLAQVNFFDDFPYVTLDNIWNDTGTGGFGDDKLYVVQTTQKTIQRCLLMTTDPGDLVFDPTCGSGTTAYVAEQWGRRWITSDTSRVAVAITKQRLMTAVFDYYQLLHPTEGISSGFKYEMIKHITLGSVAYDQPSAEEPLYDKPIIDKSKRRVSGPFTIEAVPSQRVLSLADSEISTQEADTSVARSGETVRMNDWIGELQITGIRGKSGQKIEFARVEPIGGTRYIHADGETKETDSKRVVISFGPAYAPLEQRQVELAIEEAHKLVPKPKIIAFVSFQFDPEAAKDIDELEWPGVNVLKVQMNTDLLTADLKKKRSSNESFWLVGQPDIELNKKGDKHIVEVNGFDYYNPKTGEIESGDVSKIAMWMLDTDYDGRSLYPRQIFFPMAGEKDGWAKLAKNLKAKIDEEVLDRLFKGNVSLPFSLGKNKRVAVKIIDDRGIESLKIIEVR